MWPRIALAFALVFSATAFGQVGRSAAVLDANSATEAELMSVPHVDAALAGSIVAARPFADVLELNELVSAGLGRRERGELYGRLFVTINLNSAPREAIRLIPGVSDRLAFEFEEYRPYTSIEQFRREIGKYVDGAEVARLEQYVFVPMSLNRAPRAALTTIPGMTPGLMEELDRHRPYGSLEQFRTELGKTVDAKEVARLERYLVVE
jgi:DNA uptake protein ComE-like DNA-binding protein